jgi:hypothetical protein
MEDSLLVIERGTGRGTFPKLITGALVDRSTEPLREVVRLPGPTWIQSLPLPWIRPSVAPDGRHVAVERMTDAGTDVYLLVDDTTRRTPVAIGRGYDTFLGWSPDGSALLVRRGKTLPDGGFDADLWAFHIDAGGTLRGFPIDTSPETSVQEALWSADGTRIAWVAQQGEEHQRDVYVSMADGSATENLTDDAAEEYHIAWSSDGSLLAFTGERDGNRDLFAFEFEGSTHRLWRLTNTPFAEDFASFSPDRRYVAFQSTRDTDAAVYVMPALGGKPVRVTPSGGQYSIFGWRGQSLPTYVDRFRIMGPSSMTIGDSAALSILAVDQEGITRPPSAVTMTLVDNTGVATLKRLPDSITAGRFRLVATRPGRVRIAASIPGWRSDTMVVQIATNRQSGISDDFSQGIVEDRWLSVGVPSPMIRRDPGGFSLVPNGDLQWESGLLSRELVPLDHGVDISATISAPFAGHPAPAALLQIALVSGEPLDSVDHAAPRLEPYVSLAWDGEASRLVYSVGPESSSDAASVLGSGSSHSVRITVDPRGRVEFHVDGRLRWTSSLRFLGGLSDSRARVWLGSRATGQTAAIAKLKVLPR